MSQLQPGVGYNFISDNKSYSLSIDSPGRKRSPLEVYSNPQGSSPAISVQPGSVNGLIPKIGGEYIDAVPAPKLTVSGSGYIYLKATRASGKPFPQTVEILFASDVPTDTSSNGYFAIAAVTKKEKSLQINQLVRSSLVVGRAYMDGGAIWYWFNV